MGTLLNFVTALVFLAFVTGSDNPECSPKILGPQVTKCMKTLKHLVNLASSAGPDYKSVGPEIIKDCKTFRECDTVVKCVNNASFENIIEMLFANCDAAEYFITEFTKCNDKLENLNSTCLEEWNPFSDAPINETFVDTPDDQKEACKDYYGKDECVKKDVIKTCGEEEFANFHKHQKNIVKIVGNCRLD